jgi:hypothetical protein
MSTLEKNELKAMPPELWADTETVLEHLASGRPLAPDVARRIRERGERIREETFRKHGILDIGSSAIRELRDA